MLVQVIGQRGDVGLRNPQFESHQKGARLDREAPSRYEPKDVTDGYEAQRTDNPERFSAGSEFQKQRYEKERGKQSKQPGNDTNHGDKKPSKPSGKTSKKPPVDNPENQPHSDRTPTALQPHSDRTPTEGVEGEELKPLPSTPSPRHTHRNPSAGAPTPIGGVGDPLSNAGTYTKQISDLTTRLAQDKQMEPTK